MKPIALSPALCKHLEQWNLRYPAEQKRSGIFEALRCAQEENHGFLTIELMDAVANFLDIPAIAVYEVATFYSLYHLKPVGKHVIDVCTNISCALNGAEEVLEYLKQRLQINADGTTADGNITVRQVECLGACIAPPVCQIGKTYYENLSTEKVDEILKGLSHGK